MQTDQDDVHDRACGSTAARLRAEFVNRCSEQTIRHQVGDIAAAQVAILIESRSVRVALGATGCRVVDPLRQPIELD